MHHGPHIRPQRVDRHVHGDFAGALALARQLISSQVAQDDIVELDHSLANGGRGAKDAIVIQLDADVAVVHGHPALFVDHPAHAHEVFAVFLLSLAHANSILARER